jgi:hypothetical protein
VFPRWLDGDDTIHVRGFRTEHGIIRYSMNLKGDALELRFDGAGRQPGGGMEVVAPLERPLRAATVNGNTTAAAGHVLRLDAWPRHLVLQY